MAYAELLSTTGVRRGLLGPAEAARIWDRHLVNCAVVAELLVHGSRVVDVGSGAGLPGIAVAIARPDLTVVLVEPSARRVTFLAEAAAALALPSIRVVRGRADEAAVRAAVAGADVVTARAVAPLGRLVGWCLPLVRSGGRVLAIKGVRAEVEIVSDERMIRRAGGARPVVRYCGRGVVEPATTVVEIVKL